MQCACVCKKTRPVLKRIIIVAKVKLKQLVYLAKNPEQYNLLHFGACPGRKGERKRKVFDSKWNSEDIFNLKRKLCGTVEKVTVPEKVTPNNTIEHFVASNTLFLVLNKRRHKTLFVGIRRLGCE